MPKTKAAAVPPAKAPRGRPATKVQPLQPVELNPDAIAEMQVNRALLHATTASYSAERDLVNQLLGQAQMADASAKFSRTVRISKLAFVKENKHYKALAGMKTPHGAEFSGTWEEFCGLLGQSVDQVDRDIDNLRTFGGEALEAMSRMGIGYRELRQFRQLSADDHSALAEVALTGDKDAVLDLAEELLGRQAKEREKLSDRLEKKSREYDSLSERQRELSEQLDEAKSRASLLPRFKPDRKAEEMLLELQKDVAAARAYLRPAMRSIEAFNLYLRKQDITGHDNELSMLMIELLDLVIAPLVELDLAGVPQPLEHVKSVVIG
jgi:hypothetical protein